MNKIKINLGILLIGCIFVSKLFAFTPVIGFMKGNSYSFSSTGNQVLGIAANYTLGLNFTNGSNDGAFYYPMKSAVDTSSGHNFLYVTDENNNRIVRLNATTGAFMGAIGYVDSVTSYTNIGSPVCVAGMANQWCYGGHFISSQTFGGFGSPRGIAIDAANDLLYVSDTFSRIIKIQASTGQTLAATGNVAVAGTSNCTTIGPANTWCTSGTIGNTGTAYGQFNVPEGLTYDSTTQSLYVADTGNHRIVRIATSSGISNAAIGNVVTKGSLTCTLLGQYNAWCLNAGFSSSTTDTGFNTPKDVVVDVNAGALYIADTGNHRIVKVNLLTGSLVGKVGYVSTAASTGTNACSAQGVTSTWCTGGTISYSSVMGGFNSPSGLAFDASRNLLYVTDENNSRIVKINTSTTTVNGALSGGSIGGIGYVGNAGGTCSTVGVTNNWCSNGSSGLFTSGSQDGMYGLPASVSLDLTNGFLYISDKNNHRIIKANLSDGRAVGSVGNIGAGTSIWTSGGKFSGGPLDNSFNSPKAIAVDYLNKFLYIVDTYNNRIVKIDASTGNFEGAIGYVKVAGGTCGQGVTSGWCKGGEFGAAYATGAFYFPSGIALDSINNILYVADTQNHRIAKINADTGNFLGAIGYVSSNTGGCALSSGQSIASNWCLGSTFGASSADGGFNNPTGLTIDFEAKNLYVADTGNFRIAKISLSTNGGSYSGGIGYVTNSSCGGPSSATSNWCSGGAIFGSGSGDGAFNAPEGIVIDSTNKYLYVSDTLNNRITRVDVGSGTYAGSIGNVSVAGNTCNSVGVTNNFCAGGTFTSSTLNGAFNNPKQITIDNSGGNLYVTDFYNNRIEKIVIKNNSTMGLTIGSLGNNGSSLAPCTLIGAVNSWCPGMNFNIGISDGMFNAPYGIAVDPTTNTLFVSETSGNRVQKISPKK